MEMELRVRDQARQGQKDHFAADFRLHCHHKLGVTSRLEHVFCSLPQWKVALRRGKGCRVSKACF
jgi:hypothetical protein